MFNALGVGGGGSLIGGVAALLCPVPFIFYKYGGPIRERSKFAPTSGKKDGVKQEVPQEQDTRRGREGSETTQTSSAESVVHEDVEKEGEVGSNGEKRTYYNEGQGLDRVARPDDTRMQDAGQLDGEPKMGADRDVEKGL